MEARASAAAVRRPFPRPADLLRALHDLSPADDAAREQIARLLDRAWAQAADQPVADPLRDPPVGPEVSAGVAAAEPTRPGRGRPWDADRVVAPSSLRIVRGGPPDAPEWLRVPGLPVAPTTAHPSTKPEPLLVPELARGVLVAALERPVMTRAIDVELAVRAMARGEELTKFPLARVKSVAPRVQLLCDRSETMLPFVGDLTALARDVERVIGAERLEVLRFAGCPTRGAGRGSRRTWSSDFTSHMPPPGSCVLVATDLGITPPGADMEEWIEFGRALDRAGCRGVVFLPHGPERWPAAVCRHLTLVHWDRRTGAREAAAFVRNARHHRNQPANRAEEARMSRAQRLARRAAFAVRADAPLLRALRVELLPGVDGGSEADVWALPDVRFRGPDGLVFDADAADRLRAQLAAESTDAYESAWQVTERLHAHLPEAIRVEEELCYLHRSREPHAPDRTRELLRATIATLVTQRDDLATWALRAASELPSEVSESELGQMLATAARLRLQGRLIDTPDLPEGSLPDWVAWVTPDTHPRVAVGVVLLRGGMELSEPPAHDAWRIELPATDPLVIEVTAHHPERNRRVELTPRGRVLVRVKGPVTLRAASGLEWEITEAERTGGASAGGLMDLHAHYPMHLLVDEQQRTHERARTWWRRRWQSRAVELIAGVANYQGPGDTPSVTAELMRAGGVGIVMSALYQPWDELDLTQPYGAPPRQSYFDDLVDQRQTVEDHVASRPESAVIAHSLPELEALLGGPRPILIHCVEGGFHLGRDAEEVRRNVRTLAQLGVAYVTVAHLFFRQVATGAPSLPFLPDWLYNRVFPQQAGEGLTALGREVVLAMVDEGVLIDITHMRAESIRDVLALLDERDPAREIPVIATHMAYRFGGLQYCLDDETIRAVAARGGVLGCILCEHYITSGLPATAKTIDGSMDALCRHIDKVSELTGGFDHVGIGSDLDGYIKPALPGLEHMGRMGELQGRLRKRYGEANAEKICSGNALRVLRRAWRRPAEPLHSERLADLQVIDV